MPKTMEFYRASLLSAAFFMMTATAWLTVAIPTANAEIAARPGWVITPTSHKYLDLTQRVADATKRHKITVVGVASATAGVLGALKEEIPGNMVIGLYHPRFAKRTLAASIPAGIEAPIRIYVTENPDKTATLSYKKPSMIFCPLYGRRRRGSESAGERVGRYIRCNRQGRSSSLNQPDRRDLPLSFMTRQYDCSSRL